MKKYFILLKMWIEEILSSSDEEGILKSKASKDFKDGLDLGHVRGFRSGIIVGIALMGALWIIYGAL